MKQMKKIISTDCMIDNRKRNTGITLIALVITIIILIILAAIAINAVFGENGLILRAQEAKFKTEVSGIKDLIDVKRLELEASKYLNGTAGNLSAYLNGLNNLEYIGPNKLVIDGKGKLAYNPTGDFSELQMKWLEEIGVGFAENDEDEEIPEILGTVLLSMDDLGSTGILKITELGEEVDPYDTYCKISFSGKFDFRYYFESYILIMQDNIVQMIENNPSTLLLNINQESDTDFTTITELKTYLFNNTSVTSSQLAQGLIISTWRFFLSQLGYEEEIRTTNDVVEAVLSTPLVETNTDFNILKYLQSENYSVRVTKPDFSFVIISLQDIPDYDPEETYSPVFIVESNGCYTFEFIPPELQDIRIIFAEGLETIIVNMIECSGGDTGIYDVVFDSPIK